jgi:hypothetical protein
MKKLLKAMWTVIVNHYSPTTTTTSTRVTLKGVKRIVNELGGKTKIVPAFDLIHLNDRGLRSSTEVVEKNNYGKVLVDNRDGVTVVELLDINRQVQLDRTIERLEILRRTNPTHFTSGGIVFDKDMTKYVGAGALLYTDVPDGVSVEEHIVGKLSVSFPPLVINEVFDKKNIAESFSTVALPLVMLVENISRGASAVPTDWGEDHPLFGLIYKAGVNSAGVVEVCINRWAPKVISELNTHHAEISEIETNYGTEFLTDDVSVVKWEWDKDPLPQTFTLEEQISIKRYLKL